MKAAKTLLCLLVFVLAAMPSASALAWRGGHARIGVYIGGPAYWYPPYNYSPYFYPQYYPPYYPAYAYPPVVVAPSAPQTYIEQGGGPPAAVQSQPPSQAQSSQSVPQANWWHYCADAKAYYPYVKECPAGWQRVAPQPQQ